MALNNLLESAESAQQKLRILTVNLRGATIGFGENTDVWSIQTSKAEITQQSLRRFAEFQEAELVSTDKDLKLWQYTFSYALGVRLLKKNDKGEDDDENPLLVISAQFAAVYLSDGKLTEDEVNAFSRDQAVVHIWPYWREYVQSSCFRLGLSRPINVPTFVLNGSDGAL